MPGLAYHFNQKFFKDLENLHGVALENIVYYKNNHHYFVMSAKKPSLLQRGVLKQDFSNPEDLLQRSNVDKSKLETYVSDTVQYATEGQISLKSNNFSKNGRGNNDVAIFDFTNRWQAKMSSITYQVVPTGRPLLTVLIGDALLNPFWPMGTGIGRGFQGCLDAAWFFKEYVQAQRRNIDLKTQIILAKEAISRYELSYQRIYANMDSDSDLKRPFTNHSLDPRSRYKDYESVTMNASSRMASSQWKIDQAARDSLSRPSIAVDQSNPVFEDLNASFAQISETLQRTSSRRKSDAEETKIKRKKSIENSKITPQIGEKVRQILSLVNGRVNRDPYNLNVGSMAPFEWVDGKILMALVHGHDSKNFDESYCELFNLSSPERIEKTLKICEDIYNVQMFSCKELMFFGEPGGLDLPGLVFKLDMLLRAFKKHKSGDKIESFSRNTPSQASFKDRRGFIAAQFGAEIRTNVKRSPVQSKLNTRLRRAERSQTTMINFTPSPVKIDKPIEKPVPAPRKIFFDQDKPTILPRRSPSNKSELPPPKISKRVSTVTLASQTPLERSSLGSSNSRPHSFAESISRPSVDEKITEVSSDILWERGIRSPPQAPKTNRDDRQKLKLDMSDQTPMLKFEYSPLRTRSRSFVLDAKKSLSPSSPVASKQGSPVPKRMSTSSENSRRFTPPPVEKNTNNSPKPYKSPNTPLTSPTDSSNEIGTPSISLKYDSSHNSVPSFDLNSTLAGRGDRICNWKQKLRSQSTAKKTTLREPLKKNNMEANLSLDFYSIEKFHEKGIRIFL